MGASLLVRRRVRDATIQDPVVTPDVAMTEAFFGLQVKPSTVAGALP